MDSCYDTLPAVEEQDRYAVGGEYACAEILNSEYILESKGIFKGSKGLARTVYHIIQ